MRGGTLGAWESGFPLTSGGGLADDLSVLSRRANRDGRIRSMVRKVRAGAARLRPLIERRKSDRLKGSRIRCSLGEVVDISTRGMRVRSPRRLHGQLTVDLEAHGQRVRAQAKVVWCTREGMIRRYVAGLKFLQIDDDASRSLEAIAALLAAE